MAPNSACGLGVAFHDTDVAVQSVLTAADKDNEAEGIAAHKSAVAASLRDPHDPLLSFVAKEQISEAASFEGV